MAITPITEARFESHVSEHYIYKHALVKKPANYVAFSKFIAAIRELQPNLR